MIDYGIIYLVAGILFATTITVEYAIRLEPLSEWYKEVFIFFLHVAFWPVWLIMLAYFYIERHYVG